MSASFPTDNSHCSFNRICFPLNTKFSSELITDEFASKVSPTILIFFETREDNSTSIFWLLIPKCSVATVILLSLNSAISALSDTFFPVILPE